MELARLAFGMRHVADEHGVPDRALARHAVEVLGANRVFLTTDERNLRSRLLAERAGFEYEGTLRKDRLDLEGRLRNTRVYAIVA